MKKFIIGFILGMYVMLGMLLRNKVIRIGFVEALTEKINNWLYKGVIIDRKYGSTKGA